MFLLTEYLHDTSIERMICVNDIHRLMECWGLGFVELMEKLWTINMDTWKKIYGFYY